MLTTNYHTVSYLTSHSDYTARIWNMESGECLMQYTGHSGSVNSIQFHPSKDLVVTASGDQNVHIWQAAVNWEQLVGVYFGD